MSAALARASSCGFFGSWNFGERNTLGLTSSSLWPAIKLDSANTGSFSFSLPHEFDWNDGSIAGLSILYSMEGAEAAYIEVKASSKANANIATPEMAEAFTIDLVASANFRNTAVLTFAAPLAFSRGDMLLVRGQRIPGNAATPRRRRWRCWG